MRGMLRFTWLAQLAVLPVGLALLACAQPQGGAGQPVVAASPANERSEGYGGAPWTTPIRANPVLDPRSAQIARALTRSAPVADLYEYGVPVFTGTEATPRYRVRCTMPWGPCPLERQPVPIPGHARPSPGSDGAMAVIDEPGGRVYDFWQARKVREQWVASWGAVNPLTGTPTDGATGAAIPLLAGLVRLTDIRQGRIEHALTFSSSLACHGVFRYPALKTDGLSRSVDCIPEGARVQLDPSIDVDRLPGLTVGERMIAKALQKYGAYCRDRGGALMAIIFENPAGKPDPYPSVGLRWDYYGMSHIPWRGLRVLRSWRGS